MLGYMAGFLKDTRISLFVYDTDKKSFVSRWSRNAPLEGSVESRMSLSGRLRPVHQEAESATSITFVDLPFEKHMTALGPRAISRVINLITNDHSRSLFFEVNRTSTTGSLLCSKDRHSIVFETPDDCFPFLHLSLNGGEVRGGHRQWDATLAYEKEGMWGKYDIERHKSCIETHKYAEDVSVVFLTPFDAFASVMRGFLSQYISMVKEEAKDLMGAIHEVENSLASEQRPSTLLRQLNTIGRKIRVSSLKKQFAFSIDAAEWMTEISAPPDPSDPRRSLQFDLLLSARRMEQYHPDRLRETVSEVHQHIEDIVAERQQERQEQLQLREDARAEREERLQEESIRIAEETKRDSRTMRGIAWVTIAFLPATFVS